MRIITTFGAMLSLLTATVFLSAAETKSVEGTLLAGERTYKLAHAVAFELKSGDDSNLAILASDRKLPIDKIKADLANGKVSEDAISLSQPHIMVTFDKAGKAVRCTAWADNSSFVKGGKSITSDVVIDKGRVRGQVKLPNEAKRNFQSGFEFRVDIPLGLDAVVASVPKPVGVVKPTVTGTFKGNGKAAKLAFVSARPGEAFNDKASIVLIFTEKDHSRDKQPHLKTAFGDYGSALIISLHEDGGIFGCEVAHAAHPKKPFSSIGSIRTVAFDVEAGKVAGQIATDGEQDTFGQKWQVDVKFVAPYTAPAAKPVAATAAPSNKRDARPPVAKAKTPSEPAKKVAVLNVRDLAILKDASDVDYKTLVEQLDYRSAVGVQALCGDISKKLAAQGWKGDGSDLVTPKSAILSRNRDGATLTIFVKPADKGSHVRIMTTGLDWTEK